MKKRAVVIVAFLCLGAWASGQEKAPVRPPNVAKDNVLKSNAANGNEAKDNTVKVLRTTNRAQTNRFVCETFEFKNLNPFNIAVYLWMATSHEEGGIYAFANPDGKTGFLTVICPEYQLESLRKLAKELDREDLSHSSGNVRNYYRMRHRNVDDPNLLKVISYWTGTSIRLASDSETNSLYIEGAQTGSETLIKELREELDRPLTQVEVTVKIYEVAVSSDGAMGLDFEAWKNGPGKVLYQLANKARRLAYSRSDGSISANTNAQGFYLDYPTAFFDFLAEKGKAKILTSAKVMTMNKAQAQVVAGDRILFYQEAEANTLKPATGDVTSDREVQGTLAAADTGVTLNVTPTVGEKTINLDLNLVVNNVLGYDATGAPVMAARTMVNSVTVADGGEIVFGGLVRKRHLGMTRKVPVLGSLPVIGYLVGGEQEISRETTIITAVTARLVDNLDDNVTDDDKLVQSQAEGKSPVVLP
ncbi:MAG: hypothetical protein NTX50_25265 [Candidatus Sumerlaeota bacterium]|nr:hypothetical protein [Candidatus Sumerlaeota bacterium]